MDMRSHKQYTYNCFRDDISIILLAVMHHSHSPSTMSQVGEYVDVHVEYQSITHEIIIVLQGINERPTVGC